MKQKGLLLTEGDVFTVLLKFSLPFLMANILQALYGASDLFMVGRFSNSAGVSAVATGGQIMQTITGLSIGLTTGGTVVIAQRFGARNRQGVADAAATVLIVFGLLGLVMSVGTILLIEPICRLMLVPPEALEITKEYLFICACGILFIIGYNAVSGILRGLGDSKTPLLFVTIACFINVSTDLLFVGVLKWGAPGAAVSTVIAQAASLALALIFLTAKGYLKKFHTGKPIFSFPAAKGIIGVGLPVAMQDGLVNVSFLIITAIINSLGLIASASVGVVEKLIVFSMLPVAAFSSAIAAMTAQHLGAGLMERARKCLNTGIGLSLLFGAAFFLCAQVNAEGMVSLFTTDPMVILAGAEYLRSYSIDVIAVCFVFCMNAFFSGSGHSLFPLIHSLIATFVIRIPLSYLLSRPANASLFEIGFAAPAASILSTLLCGWFLNAVYSKKKRRTESRQAPVQRKTIHI